MAAPLNATATAAVAATAATTADALRMDDAATTAAVKRYYGEVLSSRADLETSACCAAGAPPPEHIRAILAHVPAEVKEKFYGCGSPLPLGITGLRVLDLGRRATRVSRRRQDASARATLLVPKVSVVRSHALSPRSGSGRDCYVASALVGPSGRVTGVDMTEALLGVARAHAPAWAARLGYDNMRFLAGRIEALGDAGVGDASVDLVISNCVVNLSPDKRAVLREAHRVLAHGGEFYFSDVYADRRLPAAARQDPLLVGECLGVRARAGAAGLALLGPACVCARASHRGSVGGGCL
jgi:SAM-dependent methyltransferase